MKAEGSSTSNFLVINQNIQELGEAREHNSQDISFSCLGGE